MKARARRFSLFGKRAQKSQLAHRRGYFRKILFEHIEGRIATGALLTAADAPGALALLGAATWAASQSQPERVQAAESTDTAPYQTQANVTPSFTFDAEAGPATFYAQPGTTLTPPSIQPAAPSSMAEAEEDTDPADASSASKASGARNELPAPMSGGGGATPVSDPGSPYLPVLPITEPLDQGARLPSNHGSDSPDTTPPPSNQGNSAGPNLPPATGTNSSGGNGSGTNGSAGSTAGSGGSASSPSGTSGTRPSVPRTPSDNFDGNQDGTPDRLQEHVESVFTHNENAIVTLDAKGRRLRDVQAMAEPDVGTRAVRLPHGMVDFKVDVTPGGSATVDLVVPEGKTFDGYYKFDQATNSLSRFDFDGATGAVINGNVITLHFVDGGRGDADGVVNGVIHDPGGPGENGVIDIGLLGGAEQWTIREHDGKSSPGSVTTDGDDLVLHEGDSFSVAMERTLTIPQNPTILTFDYTATFDTAEPDFINDAFEASFLGSDGASLVPTIRLHRDTFFNHTEGETTKLGSGTTVVGQTVELDISQLTPGSTGKLVLRLVNNDSDTDTTVRIPHVQPVSAANDTYSVNEDTTLTIAAAGVLSNDTGAATALLVTDPQHGQVTLQSDGSFVYTPNANFTGTDSFTYRAVNGANQSPPATVTITVNPVADAPVAVNDSYSTNEDTTLVVAAAGVLANDSDVDGPALQAVLVSAPAHGTLTFNADGSFEYVPSANYNGSDSFTYRVSNGLQSNVATVALTINAVNDPPIAVDDVYSATMNTALSINSANGVLKNDSDPESQSITAVLVSNPSNGTLTLNSNGSFTYTPNTGFKGADSFTYKARDASSADSAVREVTILVGPELYEVPGGPDTLWVITVAIEAVNISADYENELGLYLVNGVNGQVGSYVPNDSGYDNAALTHPTRQIVFAQPPNGQNDDLIGQTYQIVLSGGTQLAFFLVQNSNLQNQLANNPNNASNLNPKTFFSFSAANPDSFQHFRTSVMSNGKILYEVEDQTNGGDQDYNDLEFSVSTTPTAVEGPIKFLVADNGVDRLYQYNPTGYWVGQPQFDAANTNARGVASNASGNRRWVIDDNDRVYVYDGQNALLGSWQVSGLSQPEDIATDGTNLWIVDAGLDQVLYFAGAASLTSSGSAIAATSSFSLHANNTLPKGLATNGSRMWVTDTSTDRVYVYTTGGVYEGQWQLDSANVEATGITNDPTNATSDLWTVDKTTRKVYHYANATTRLTSSGAVAATGSFSLGISNLSPEGIADPAPVVTISQVQDAQEGVSAGYFRLQRDQTSGTLTVDYHIDTMLSTATNGTDFASLPTYYGQVTFASGQATVDIAVDPTGIYDDTIVEGNETVRLVLDMACGCCCSSYMLGATSAATLTIADNDVAPEVWIDDVEDATEGVAAGYVRLRRDITTSALTVSYTFDSYTSTATQGTDFANLPGTGGYQYGSVTFAAGVATVDIPVNPTGSYNDSTYEGDETVKIQLETDCCCCCGPAAYTLGSPATATLTIADDEQPTAVWIDTVQDAHEGVSAGYFRLRRDVTAGALTVYYLVDVGSSTARNGIDFPYVPGTSSGWIYGSITFGSGQATVDIPIDPRGSYDDALAEGDEEFRIQLVEASDCCCCSSGPAPYALGATPAATLTIADNEPKVWIETVQHAQEGVSDGYVRIRRNQLSGSLSVNYRIDTAVSTSTNGIDYYYLTGTNSGSSNHGTVTFTDGQEYIDLIVSPLGMYDDAIYEGDETLRIALEADANGGACCCCCCVGSPAYSLGAPHHATLTIADNEPTVWIDRIQDAVEGTYDGYVRLRRSSTAGSLSVQYSVNHEASTATNGLDLAYPPGTGLGDHVGQISFATGQATVDIPLAVLGVYDDTAVEGNETVHIQLQTIAGGAYGLGPISAGVANIADGDLPVVVIVQNIQAAIEGVGAGYIRLQRDVTTGPYTVHYLVDTEESTAELGEDYAYTSGTSRYDQYGQITFPDGAATVDILIDPTNDYDDLNYEGDERVDLLLMLNEPTIASVPILENDTQRPADWDHLIDVTASTDGDYHVTSWNEDTEVLYTELDLRHVGTAPISGPVYVGIRNLTSPLVSVLNIAGVTPDGIPYYDISSKIFTAADKTFDPGEIAAGIELAFRNPERIQFHYELVVFGYINRAPEFTTDPVLQVAAGGVYHYDAQAIDPERDDLTYEKLMGPAGLQVAPVTGDITWQTTLGDVGRHSVLLRVRDTDGLWDEQRYDILVTDNLLNRPPRFTSTPVGSAYVNTDYAYFAKAFDPDGDQPLRFSLLEAVRDANGQSLASQNAAWAVQVDPYGLVTWEPPAELVGETVSLLLEVTDGHGGVDVQPYTIYVHGEPGNHPPVIVSQPSREFFIPSVTTPANSNATPSAVHLDLGPGETVTVPITFDLDPNTAFLGADIIFVVDESGSMSGGHEWIRNMVLDLEDELVTRGITSNRYGLVGYGDGSIIFGHSYLVDGEKFGSAEALYDATSQLVLDGGDEDGWDGIDQALDSYEFRPGAAVNVILITDEDRDNVNPALTYSSVLADLGIKDAMLNVVVSAAFQNGAAQNALGVDYAGNAFVADGLGGFTISTGGVYLYGSENTKQDYIDLAWATQGAAWNIDPVRQQNSDLTVQSLSKAFVEVKGNEIEQQLLVNLLGNSEYFANLSGILNILETNPLTFQAQFIGDGLAHAFELQLVQEASGALLASIPVSINAHYRYDTDAVDADGDTLAYSLVGETHGASIDSATGALTWLPSADGQYQFKVRVTDGRGGVDEQIWTVNVGIEGQTNNAPSISSTPPTEATVERPLEYQVTATDADGDNLQYFLDADAMQGMAIPAGVSIAPHTGLIRWTPTLAQQGTHTFQVKVSDGRTISLPQTIMLEVTVPSGYFNTDPQINSLPTLVATAGQHYRYAVEATDPDLDPLEYSLAVAPDGMAIDPQSGLIGWRPTTEQAGLHTVLVRVHDGRGGVTVQAFTIAVSSTNDPPTIEATQPAGGTLGAAWTYQVEAADPNGDVLSYALDAASFARGMAISSAGVISWTPSAVGDYRAEVAVSDGRGGLAFLTLTIPVRDNAPPSITLPPFARLLVDQAWPHAVTVADPDVGDTVTLSLDQASLNRGIALAGTTLSWTPPTIGDFPVTLTATDGQGGVTTLTFTIPVRAPIVASEPPTITSTPTGPAYVNAAWTYQVTATDVDSPASSLVYSLQAPANGTPNVSFDANTGTITWTPSATGSMTFTMRVTDPQGSYAEQIFTVPAQLTPPTNAPPKIASIPSGPAVVGLEYNYQLVAYDPNGDALTYSISSAPTVSGLTISETGLLTWNAPSTVGNVVVDITVDDGQAQVTQQFTLPVVAPNNGPIISTNPTGPAYVNQAWTYTIAANDPDGNDAELVYALQSPAPGNEVSFDPQIGTLTWTPSAVGTQTFTLRVTDEQSAYVEQTFTVPAEAAPPTNLAPVIRSLPGSPTHAGRVYTYQVDAYDPNGDQLTYSLDALSQQRGIQINSRGALTWPPGVTGDYPITISVDDGVNAPTTQTFTLTVLPPATVNDPPQITSQPTGPAVRNRAYQYQAVATDLNGDAIEWSLDLSQVPVDTRGDLGMDDESGLLTWTPTVAGNYTLVVIADDGQAQALQTFQLRVLDNAPPVITSPPLPRGWNNQAYSHQVMASDPNPGDTLTYTLIGAPSGMTIDSSGFISWATPNEGSHTITVTVSDQDGASARQTSNLRIDNPSANTPPDITSNPPTEIQVGQRFLHQVAAYDVDGDNLIYTLVSGPAGMTMDSAGLIDWQPTSAAVNGSPHSYTVRVSDGVNAAVDEVFTISVVHQRQNHAPEFTSTPGTNLVAGKRYLYDANADDVDGDSYRFSLVSAPAGMTINADTGVVEWHPTIDHVGQHTMTVQVIDSLGLGTRQTVTLTVRPTNRPPRVDNDPIVQAVLNQPYTHDIAASDPDGHQLTYSIGAGTNVPGSISVHPDTGVVSWTPTATGDYQIQVNIYDELGLGIALLYGVRVLATAPNTPPQITGQPALSAEAGVPWAFPITTVDPDTNQTITESVVSPDPLLSNMTFVDDEIVWTPDVSLVGQLVTFEVHATDGIDTAKLRFSVRVQHGNTAPSLTTIPDRTVTVGAPFQYDVKASDVDQDPLQFGLDSASIARGMTIDNYGRIHWNANSGDLANSPYNVTVSVTDGRSAPITDDFVLTVAADSVGPEVSIHTSTAQAPVGQEIVILVHAVDNVGLANRTLTLLSVSGPGGATTLNRELPLDNAGRARLLLTEELIGTLTFAATATDINSLTSNATNKTFLVTDPSDVDPPSVSLASPGPRAKISEPTDVLGSVADDTAGVTWTLTARPADGGDAIAIASGSGNITNALLGRFDTTLVRNGFYEVTLIATDSGGHHATATAIVEVEGNLKLGNFTMSFVDLELPVSGLPIVVTRTYDTLRADQDGDFGYGWRLDVSDTKITINHDDQLDSGTFGYTPFRDGTRIVVTLPDGSTEGFTFRAQNSVQGFIQTADYSPTFIADPGVKSELIVDHRWIRKLGDTYIDMETGRDYSPVDPVLGGAYTLKLRNGNEMVIDASTGRLDTIIDRNGNTLTFGDWGIEHSSGRGVYFERDEYNRITAILTPDATPNDWGDNPRLQYSYDENGNLISFTDRTNNTTHFEYRTDRDHYLDRVIDPLGRPAAQTQFDEQGRISKVIDAAGKTIEYTYEVAGKTQVIRDQLNNVTIYTHDARGNVVREVDAEGGIVKRIFDSEDRLLSETRVIGLEDSLSNETNDLTTSSTYDADGNKLTETDARGNFTRYTYNSYGQVLSVSGLGGTTTSNYDESGLLRSMRDANGNVSGFSYDVSGNLTGLKNHQGQTLLTSSYNSYGEVTSTTPTVGRQTSFDYDHNGRQVASWYFDGAGPNQVQVLNWTEYDDSGNVLQTKQVQLLAGQFITTDLATAVFAPQYVLSSTSTTYTATGQTATTTDQVGLVTQHTYDDRGLRIQTRRQAKDSAGNTSWLIQRTVYDAAGRAVVSTDEYLEGTTEPITGSRSIYDAVGRVTHTEQLRGVVIALDSVGTFFRTTLTNVGTVIATSSTQYDNAGRVILSIDNYGHETHTTYNAFGETVETRTQSRNAAGNLVWLVSRTLYDSQGRAEYTTDQYLEGASDPILGTRTVYDEQGRAVKSLRLTGLVIGLTGGNTVLTTAGTELSRSETFYDNHGRVSKTIDAAGRINEFEYDIYDRQVAVIEHPVVIAGQSVRHRSEKVFDSQGRLELERINVRQLENGTIDRSQARETSYEYDEFNRVVKTTFADDTFITTTYDALGRKASETNQLQLTRTFEYDSAGRLAAVVLPAVINPATGLAANPRYEYGYDAQGNQNLIRDPLGRETRFTFDDRGQQLTRTLPLGFGADGQLGTGDDTALPEGSFSEQFQYDTLGREALHISFEGVHAQSVYDEQTGRLAERRYYANSAAYTNQTPAETWTYTYDAFGREVEVTQTRGSDVRTVTTTYHTHGRVQAITSPEGTVNYRYDALGRQTRVFTGTDVNPINDTHYSYDALGRLATVAVYERNDVTLGTLEQTTFAYDLLGNLDAETKPNDVVSDYTYDELQRLDTLRQFKDNNANGAYDAGVDALIAEYDYTVRDDGKRTSVIETFWFDNNADSVPDAHTNQISWTYDNAGRLTDEVFNHYDNAFDQTEHFVYDLVGNRLSQTLDRGNDSSIEESTTYTYDANDRLTLEVTDTDDVGTAADRSTSYTYDHTQQTGKAVLEGGVAVSSTDFAYDLQGRLEVATVTTHTAGVASRIETTTYDYDARGIRVSALHEIDSDASGTVDASTKTEYLNDAQSLTGYSQVLQETVIDPATGEIQKRIVYAIGHDQISQTTIPYSGGVPQTAETLFFATDGHGSVRVFLDIAGAIASVAGVQQLFHYDAYGNALGFSAAQAATSYLYSGEQFDTRIGQQYLRARYYDPNTGRFNRLDPFFGNLNDPQSLHKYAYAHEDPIQGVDPSGWNNAWFAPLVLGTHVSTYLGRLYKSLTTTNSLRWANQEIRTIASDLIASELPDEMPFTGRPDLAEAALTSNSGTIYEIKRGSLAGLINPIQMRADAAAAAPQLTFYLATLNQHTQPYTWTTGVTAFAGLTPHPLFVSPFMPRDSMLVTFNDYTAHPGVLLYDFVPIDDGKLIPVPDLEVVVGVNIIGQQIAQRIYVARQLQSATTLAFQGKQADNQRLRMAASIGFVGVGLGLSGALAVGFS